MGLPLQLQASLFMKASIQTTTHHHLHAQLWQGHHVPEAHPGRCSPVASYGRTSRPMWKSLQRSIQRKVYWFQIIRTMCSVMSQLEILSQKHLLWDVSEDTGTGQNPEQACDRDSVTSQKAPLENFSGCASQCQIPPPSGRDS